MANKTSSGYQQHFETFEEAREATLRLLALKDILTPGEIETLEIMLDQKAMEQLAESVREAEKGETEPLENILK